MKRIYFAEFYNKGELVLQGPGNGKNKEDAEFNAIFAAEFKHPDIIYDIVEIYEFEEN